ncbi:hypothetical protein [Streptacidiphilus sp. PAMC 29251]
MCRNQRAHQSAGPIAQASAAATGRLAPPVTLSPSSAARPRAKPNLARNGCSRPEVPAATRASSPTTVRQTPIPRCSPPVARASHSAAQGSR